ncbi:site-specific integrase [Cognatilysobacter bugurensis]|nr:site-specific integrase [Lysobacter bugurensis]
MNEPLSAASARALSSDQQSAFLSMLDPEIDGHGASPELRSRNQVIGMTLMSCGLRSGEFLLLKVSDIKFGAIPSLEVVRRPPDPQDVRRPRPRVKRQGRVLPLDPSLARALNNYIMRDREVLAMRSSIDSPYLILSDEGEPLSRARLNALFVEFRSRLPGMLPEDFSPHSLRHTFSCEIEKGLAEAGFSEEKRASALALMRGDTSLASQDVYLQRETERRAHKALSDYQARTLASAVRSRE